MSAFTALSTAALKGFFRDRVALFFSFAFPLMFIVIFGLIFSDSGEEKIDVGVVGDGPVTSALRSSGAFELKEFTDPAKAFDEVKSGDLPAFVQEKGNSIELRFAVSDQVQSATVRGVVEGVVNELNFRSANVQPTYRVDASQVEDSSLKSIQFIIPGMLSWGVALGAIFGSAFTLVSWRKKQVLRRIRSAPVSLFVVLTSRLTATILIGIVQAAVFLGVGLLPAFGLQLTGEWYLSLPILIFGIVAFFAIGLVVGSICKTEEATSAVANMIVVPMAFLSGVFIPLDVAPAWLRSVSNFMPLKHMNEGMSSFLVRGQPPSAMVIPLLVLFGVTVAATLLASRIFKWEAA